MYCIHTFKHKALEMRTAEETQKPMRGFAALARTHRCHWQIWASPPALLPLQSALKPTGTACVGATAAKPQISTADSFLLVTPITSVPDLRRQAGTKGMKGKSQTLCPGTQFCPAPVWCEAKQLPSPLLPASKRGKKSLPTCLPPSPGFFRASPLQTDYKDISLVTSKLKRPLQRGVLL